MPPTRKQRFKTCIRCGGQLLPHEDRILRADDGHMEHLLGSDCARVLLQENERLKQEIEDLKSMISEGLKKD